MLWLAALAAQSLRRAAPHELTASCFIAVPIHPQIKFVVDKDGNPTKLGAGAQGVVYKVGALGATCACYCGRGAAPATGRRYSLASKLYTPALQALLNSCEPVAVKVVPMAGMAGAGEAGGSAAAFFHEARMLHGLRHRCMVQLAGVALHGDKALLIMEYMVRLRAAMSSWDCWAPMLSLTHDVLGLLHGHDAARKCRRLPCSSKQHLVPAYPSALVQEGRDLFSALNLRDKSGERMFAWHKRGKRVALDVASALAFLHARKVCHFDVKVSELGCGRLWAVGSAWAPLHVLPEHCPVGSWSS